MPCLHCFTSEGSGRKIQYTSIEKYPLGSDITGTLNYPVLSGDAGRTPFFNAIHDAVWGSECFINENFSLRKINADLTEYKPDRVYDLIYFDAFGPCKQPEMWTPGIFDMMAELMAEGGIFVTYSARGEVKRNLRRNGFMVECCRDRRVKDSLSGQLNVKNK
jgi:tRNA U34 5-methylaminomethyl-2-thiouridine-forming methyltransferase MnmC